MGKTNRIGFWAQRDKYGCFSNFYPCTFIWAGRKFNCSEQAFMWAKASFFRDDDMAVRIFEETDPKKIKRLGRLVKNYDDYEWSQVRYSFMLGINEAKYSQNKDLRDILLSTREAEIIEDSPYDYIWGIGKNGTGHNLLGKILMSIRDYYNSIAEEVKSNEKVI